MIKKDYIQRYVDELVKMIAHVLQFKQNNEPEKANEELDKFGKTYLNITFNELCKINPKILISTLQTKYKFELTHFTILEEILYHKYLLNKKDSNLKLVTLNILNYLTKTDKNYSLERAQRIINIKKEI